MNINVNDQDQKTFRDFFQTYNKMSQVCFQHCVWDFGSDHMLKREERCLMRCVDHFLAANKEIQKVFADEQANQVAKTL